jgi:glycolate oxidase FAD binding subunit
MDLMAAEQAVAAEVAGAATVVPTGAATHDEVGGPKPSGTTVRAPAGVVAYDPADLTITIGAGTTVADLAAVLADADQECPLDPRSTAATVGGTLATGLSGVRRLRYGPLRDRVLEVRFARADGSLVRGGGPTVKNVTGYDIPRLLVGSLGTLGVITRVILRCQPRSTMRAWYETDTEPSEVRRRCFRPSAILWRGADAPTMVLLEGHPDDVEIQARAAGLQPLAAEPSWPDGPHRGRISVAPGRVLELAATLRHSEMGVDWVAEWGVGTVHVASAHEDGLGRARAAATDVGGWMLREAGAPGLDGFGVELPNGELMARVKTAFDPTNKLAPGRLPGTPVPAAATAP